MAKRRQATVKPKTRASKPKTQPTDLTLVWWPTVTLRQYSLKTLAFTGKEMPLSPTLSDEIVRRTSFAGERHPAKNTSRVASLGKRATR